MFSPSLFLRKPGKGTAESAAPSAPFWQSEWFRQPRRRGLRLTIQISQFACKPTAPLATTSIAALQHWLSAMLRPRAARHNATPILFLRARESPRVIGGIAAPTKTYFVNRCAYPASDLFAITRSREPLKLRDQ